MGAMEGNGRHRHSPPLPPLNDIRGGGAILCSSTSASRSLSALVIAP